MAKLRKSWREKLHESNDLPKVVELKEKAFQNWKAGTYAIPAPIEVDEIMRRVPEGKLITINQIRDIVAKKHGAEFG